MDDNERFQFMREDDPLPSPKIQTDPNPDSRFEFEPENREPAESNWIKRFGIQPTTEEKKFKSQWVKYLDKLVDSPEALADYVIDNNFGEELVGSVVKNPTFLKMAKALDIQDRLASAISAVTGEKEEEVANLLNTMAPSGTLTGVVSNRQIVKWMIKNTPAEHRAQMLPIAKKAAKALPEEMKQITRTLSSSPDRLIAKYYKAGYPPPVYGVAVPEQAPGIAYSIKQRNMYLDAPVSLALDKTRIANDVAYGIVPPTKAISTAIHEFAHGPTFDFMGRQLGLSTTTQKKLMQELTESSASAVKNMNELMAYSYEAKKAKELGIVARYPELADTKAALISERLAGMSTEETLRRGKMRILQQAKNPTLGDWLKGNTVEQRLRLLQRFPKE